MVDGRNTDSVFNSNAPRSTAAKSACLLMAITRHLQSNDDKAIQIFTCCCTFNPVCRLHKPRPPRSRACCSGYQTSMTPWGCTLGASQTPALTPLLDTGTSCRSSTRHVGGSRRSCTPAPWFACASVPSYARAWQQACVKKLKHERGGGNSGT